MLIINPGTEPVNDATVANAELNIRHFMTDLNQKGIRSVRIDDGDRGRYGFLIWKDNRCHEIDMPGCDLEKVRLSRPFYSPRLYVDGSSWLWSFALGMCFGDDDDQ